jgi:ParB-like chromosome segregation protein Spo0J
MSKTTYTPFKSGTVDIRADKTSHISDDELRTSLKQNGWLPQLPALKDENGRIVVGNRRMRIAAELSIKPVVDIVHFGSGLDADAERIKLAVGSNLGRRANTIDDRKRLEEYLYDQGLPMPRIAEAVGVTFQQVSKDLQGFQPSRKPPRPKGGRPKEPPKLRKPKVSRARHTTEMAQRAAQLVLDEGKTHEEAAMITGLGSELMGRMAVAREQGRREQSRQTEIERAKAQTAKEKTLEYALSENKKQVAHWKREAKRLEKELDKALELPPELKKRYQAALSRQRGKDRKQLNMQIKSNQDWLGREIARADERSGSIPDDLWEALIQCTHPDGNPSQPVKTKAFLGLREREKVLRATPKEANLKIVK